MAIWFKSNTNVSGETFLPVADWQKPGLCYSPQSADQSWHLDPLSNG